MRKEDFCAVIFDMDGVLIDTERMISDCWRQIAAEEQLPDVETAIEACIGLNHADTKAYLDDKYGERFQYEAFSARSSILFKEMISREGLPLKSGVRELLQYLKEERIPIGLASSSRYETVCREMKELQLYDYFWKIIGGNMVEHSKPNPEIYSRACELMGQAPKDCIAIEDSPNGIRAASAAGMKPVMVPDLIQPTEEIEGLLFCRYNNLKELLTDLQKN